MKELLEISFGGRRNSGRCALAAWFRKVQYWHRYSAIIAQPDAPLLHPRMPYEMNRGAEKLKNLMKTVPSCSIFVLKNMAFLADFTLGRLSTLGRRLKSATTHDVFPFAARALFLGKVFLSLRISPRIV